MPGIDAVARYTLKGAGRFFRGLRARMASFVRAHGGRIAYYACVAVALSAIAYAAEQYRLERGTEADALILPAAEIEIPAEEETELFLPDRAERLRAYSAAPEWNAALGMWEIHAAVDYRLEGNVVTSLSEGTVRTVGASGVYGGFIEVETQDLLLRYASVEPAEEIEPGRRIGAGESIAVANESMPGEAHMGAHLHLELERGSEKVNFEAEANGIQPGVD